MPGGAGQIEIAAIAGSLRAASWARALLRATAELLPANVSLTIWDGLGTVPMFNQDLESGPAPRGVADLRELIQSSDAVLIATPEYNGSMPGVLKNLLDWASRPYGESVMTTKPVAPWGRARAQEGARGRWPTWERCSWPCPPRSSMPTSPSGRCTPASMPRAASLTLNWLLRWQHCWPSWQSTCRRTTGQWEVPRSCHRSGRCLVYWGQRTHDQEAA
jgi:hypothetical protein